MIVKYVRVADELVEILAADWSEPLQVRIESEDVVDGRTVLELVFRTVRGNALVEESKDALRPRLE